ncbi:hypothetical protein [Natrinema versiforme]|uniref:Uncharacterized protein n=2 Tax=root TaxID=1 RepID=A0A4P8WRG6_9EURY|nr:hypothetical protein [Natrinema versiforme]YP_010772691.1 putative viral structural protein [Natrinema versiforme icosahedral virus 1]QCS45113.1 hypothetical protein FEJ81_22855 [Natrinema versiforme]DAC85274.1 TPA_asm: putative viral structural protein [Natrinema versiforme icosahedral virus 1]
MELTALLNQFGFPTVAFLLMWKLYRDERNERREERGKWLGALQEHTATLKALRRDIRTVATDGGTEKEGDE